MLYGRVPEIIFWHIPSTAYKVVAPKFGIQKPCVGSINKESVAAQEAETGIMDLLVKRTSVKVKSKASMLLYLYNDFVKNYPQNKKSISVINFYLFVFTVSFINL